VGTQGFSRFGSVPLQLLAGHSPNHLYFARLRFDVGGWT